ncbi:hypothetical protein PMG11_10163 [Penicillium brasilianum]|uniref:Uncharacterized protein n=1 Tax=Penicillium brasilianum TaxID=104259 RepID=A0A0F7U1X7_PENBI|nr:hypothetical protein PMG11_10163 [Penicillium brasilianum]
MGASMSAFPSPPLLSHQHLPSGFHRRYRQSFPAWVFSRLGDLIPSTLPYLQFRDPPRRWTSGHHPTGMTHTTPVIVKVQGSSDHGSTLKEQIQSLPKDTKYLEVEGDTPSDVEWSILGSHFSNVKRLILRAGYNENLNDKGIPLHWPLQKLEIVDSASEVFKSPFVLEGRVSHLSLFFTCGLRFEGLTSDEIKREHDEAIESGDAQAEYITVHEGIPEEKKLKFTYLPELVSSHINKIYADPERGLNEPPAGPVNLETLEIWENDAIDTFNRMAISLPHQVDHLRTLRIRSTGGIDFHYTHESVFREVLPQLTNLKTLILAVGDMFNDPSYLPTLYKVLPPNLTELYFRGPSSLCQSTDWLEWVQAFESKEFLPNLQKLAFVLDLHWEKEEDFWKKDGPAPASLLDQARSACQPIYDIAKQRDISVVDMPAEPKSALLRPVDERWSQG